MNFCSIQIVADFCTSWVHCKQNQYLIKKINGENILSTVMTINYLVVKQCYPPRPDHLITCFDPKCDRSYFIVGFIFVFIVNKINTKAEAHNYLVGSRLKQTWYSLGKLTFANYYLIQYLVKQCYLMWWVIVDNIWFY